MYSNFYISDSSHNGTQNPLNVVHWLSV